MSEELPPGAVPPPQASDDEVTSMVRAAIEGSRLTTRKVEEGGLQQPGVTVDLTHKNIARLPDEAIDVMKMEIERLAISHNRLVTFPIKLAECSRLRYLNVRFNALKEVPQAVLKLDTLEILDLSRNRIKVLPEEIGKLKALKVLAIVRNQISRLPLSLGDLPRLQLLKFDENPLVFPPSEAYSLAKNNVNSSRPTNSNEQETMMTLEIKKFLRKKSKSVGNLVGIAKIQTPKESTPERDGFFDSAETPRASSRNRGGKNRFPIIPSNGGSVTDAAITSPSDAPPMPGIPKIYKPEIMKNSGTRSQNPSFSKPLASRGSYDPTMRPADLLTPGSNMLATNGESTNKSDHRKQSVLTPRVFPSSTTSSFLGGLSSPATMAPQTSYLVGTEGSVIRQFEPGYSDYSDTFVDRETQAHLTSLVDQIHDYLDQCVFALEWVWKAIDNCKEMTEERKTILRSATTAIINVTERVYMPLRDFNMKVSSMGSSPPMQKVRLRELSITIGHAFEFFPYMIGYAQEFDEDLVKLGKPSDVRQKNQNREVIDRIRSQTIHLMYMRNLQYSRDECFNLRSFVEAYQTPISSGPPRAITKPVRRRANTSRGISIDADTSRPPTAQGPARMFSGSTLAGSEGSGRSFTGSTLAGSEDRRLFSGSTLASSGSLSTLNLNILSSPPSSLNSSLILEPNDAALARFPTSPVDSQTSGDFTATQGIPKRGPPVEEAHFSRIIANTRKLVRLCMEEHGNGSLASNLRDFFLRKQQESMSKPTNDPRAPERFQNLAKQCHEFARDLDQVSKYISGMTDPARMNPDFLFFLKGTINAYTDVLTGSRDYRNALPADIKTEMKEILRACKEVTAALTESPWGWVMKEQAGQNVPGGAYPTTPLGAALGPAAAAAAPRSNTGNRSFNTRYDVYASNPQRRY